MFFIETHSDFTIDRFRLNLKKNGIGSISGQVLFFERKNGNNIVTSIKLVNQAILLERYQVITVNFSYKNN